MSDCNVHLYVDDLRFPWESYDADEGWDEKGDRWLIARNFHDAIHMIEKWNPTIISLDHDIASFYGNKEMTGRDILNWLIERKVNGADYSPAIVRVHSANPVGCATMEQDIARYWP